MARTKEKRPVRRVHATVPALNRHSDVTTPGGLTPAVRFPGDALPPSSWRGQRRVRAPTPHTHQAYTPSNDKGVLGMGKVIKISGGDKSTLGCAVLLIVGLAAILATGTGGAYMWVTLT